MKTYQLEWTEKMSTSVEAESKEEAIQKIHDHDYDENNLAGEIYGEIYAYETPIE